MTGSLPRRTRATLLWIVLATLATPAQAQLPRLTAPRGAVRIELRGDFAPVSDIWVGGTKRPLGSLVTMDGALDAASTPLVAEVDARVAAILGAPGAGSSLGSVSTIAEWQRGVGTIGLAVGMTRRLTVYGNLPIVSTRSQVAFAHDATTATLGLNPADPTLGSSSGINQTASFFASYDAALSDLSTRLAAGDYAGNPTLQALAQQTLTDGTELRGQLFELLADPDLSSPVLPTASSATGAALLGRISNLGAVFTDQLGIPLTGTPALPATALGDGALDALLDAPSGYGYSPRNLQPRVALGDIELGVVYAAIDRRTPTSSFGVWARGGVRLPTGEAAVASTLLDQGSGDHLLDVEAAGVVEVARRRIGIRAEASYTRQLPGDVQARIGDPSFALLPARFLAAVRRDPGDIVTVSVQPYFVLAPRLAITGLAQYTRRGADAVTLSEGQPDIPGADVNTLARNTKASATRVGAGLSYSHDGTGRDGVQRMPVEASLSIERTVASGSGLVPAALTARVMIRVYKSVW